MSQYDEDLLVEEEVKLERTHHIVVFNDQNYMDWVVLSFREVLKHGTEQAEQLAWIIDTKGKASVKEGTWDDLKPYADGLMDRGLTLEIQQL